MLYCVIQEELSKHKERSVYTFVHTRKPENYIVRLSQIHSFVYGMSVWEYIFDEN